MKTKGRLQIFFLAAAVLLMLRGAGQAAEEAPAPGEETEGAVASGLSGLPGHALDFLKGFPWGTLQAEPRLTYRLFYEDTFGVDDVDEFSNRYTPELDVSLLVSDRFELVGHTEAYIVEYQSEKDWNYVDQEHTLQLNLSLSPTTLIGLTGLYSVDTDPDRFYEGRAGSSEDGYIIKRNRDKTKTASVFFRRQLSGRGQFNLLVSYATFETAVTDDSQYYFGFINYKYDLGLKTTFTLRGTYNSLRFNSTTGVDPVYNEDLAAGEPGLFYESDYQTDTYNVSAEIDYFYDKDDRLRLKAGWRYVKRDTTNRFLDPDSGGRVTDKSSGSGDGFIFLLDWEKEVYNRLIVQLIVQQNLGTNPSSGATYENRMVRVRSTYQVSRRMSGTLQGSYYGRDTEGQEEFSTEVDRETLRWSFSLSYLLWKGVQIGLNYAHTRNENKLTSDTDRRNIGSLNITFRPTRPYLL